MDVLWRSMGDAFGHFARLAFVTACALLILVMVWAVTLRALRERREAMTRRAYVAALAHPSRAAALGEPVWTPVPASLPDETRRAA